LVPVFPNPFGEPGDRSGHPSRGGSPLYDRLATSALSPPKLKSQEFKPVLAVGLESAESEDSRLFRGYLQPEFLY
jgi:hypothetical protein